MPASRSLGELAAHVGGELLGDPAVLIHGLNGLEEAGPGEVSFYGNPRYRRQFESTRASAVLVGSDAPTREGVSLVRVSNPHLAYARLLRLFHPVARPAAGVRAGAHVHPEASVHPEATVMPGAVVESGARIGARSVLYSGAYVGAHAQVGEDCVLYPNVTVREQCVVGSRVILHASCVVGADGFGFAFNPEGDAGPEHFKIPQVGIVRIEDDVEVGACTCIDRATVGETVIGRGTKLDNLVQIAHNVRVGPLSLICAQAGVSGSAEVGTGVVLAGQVGVVGHIRVGDLAKVGAQSGVAHDVEDGQVVSGSPAVPHREWLRASAAVGQLADVLKEVRALRRRVEMLEKEKGG
ncbi:UDP-3-O-(3-hydroxymyristoyl)glucosamine N-acyltransferase [Corallococcus sp. H22C18031201]|uniref:UDP-3-O-(3-hydroxymyristoyl)glucosamine N-acyltransferase n=1 Tax=Citreicoccus inhibens TaxID=2849499 RepID=UPI000E70769C|nr:UDP-3-O-(3-hydroxymyristoyl)glucosamine N-acyltransferase [Citreicoccus inhibens]MBU8899193.1 UDP-3-O-(3-hydroxymyristoyl)glucosamine N-acyltransferase [Citreicoccus inhibens]RJS15266.1 UDP-3-O-(3-hydroxymyristoyl)glucosamine N-acyltransferase [Corallococcus sp. H22C18031201]